jgi:glycosyltransferase involved in cell wall biosynthesis
MDELLSIVILTRKRAEILDEHLRAMLPELAETGVEVVVCDGAGDDPTARVVEALRAQLPALRYHRSGTGLSFDENCLASLSLTSTPYVWQLADGFRVLPGGVKRVLEALRETPCDFAAVSATSRRAIDLPTGLYRDPVVVLERLAWHLTLAGTLIYSRAHLASPAARYAKYLGTEFSLVGIVLDNLPTCARGFLWLNEQWLSGNRAKRSFWKARNIEVFARNWAQFLLGLPGDAYPEASKRRAIREHSLRTGLFEWRWLGKLRRHGVLDRRQVDLHGEYLRLASGVPFPAIRLLASAPRWLAPPLAHLAWLATWPVRRWRAPAGVASGPRRR